MFKTILSTLVLSGVAVTGSVGVSGATGEQDEQCAMAGVSAAGLDHGVESAEE